MIFSSGYNIIISAVASFSKLQPFVLMPDTSLICSPAFFKAAQCFCSISSQSSKVQAARIICSLTWTLRIAESIEEKMQRQQYLENITSKKLWSYLEWKTKWQRKHHFVSDISYQKNRNATRQLANSPSRVWHKSHNDSGTFLVLDSWEGGPP